MNPHYLQDPDDRFLSMLQPNYPLCRDDLIWMMDFIKKRVAEGDPRLLDLPTPRLFQNFHAFCELAMMIIHNRGKVDQEADLWLKSRLAEAACGLFRLPEPPV